MSPSPSIVLHFKDIEVDEEIRDAIERQCNQLTEEFSEVTRLEVTVFENGVKFGVSGHATGKNTDAATTAEAETVRTACDQLFDKIERQLRKLHDKRIFAQRREAQRDPPKRREAP